MARHGPEVKSSASRPACGPRRLAGRAPLRIVQLAFGQEDVSSDEPFFCLPIEAKLRAMAAVRAPSPAAAPAKREARVDLRKVRRLRRVCRGSRGCGRPAARR
eukprot:tig00020693_g13040.t1